MIKIDVDKNAVLKAVDAVVRKTMDMDLVWYWPCGVAYYGVAEAFKVTGNKEYAKLLKERVDELIEAGLPPWTVNSCAMGHCLITLYEETGDEKYWQLVLSKADYITSKAPRFADGVLQHTVSVKNDFPEQAWADTLFMAAFFLLRLGVIQKDDAMINDALKQYFWHIRYLQDKETGLWYHGYDNIAKDHMSGFFWARANAWAAYTMSQVKVRLPRPYLYPEYMDVDCSLRDQLSGLRKLQTDAGLWRTVLDDPDSYEEISACSGIAAAMLINANPLHGGNAQAAYEGIMKNISDDGRVLNVSGGTAIMNNLDGYRRISREWTQGWGQGLCLAFLCAVLEALSKEAGMEDNG
ncbi:MAG: glycoside hydrolase family 88 protein [Defluviitaleaceae bacterium]|nr:glycoside hydrolase family 88 protein [Defluviitaleaceae bacterium]MCL2836705.1 glycoside hydrolase family 88 protein [Defluviitaleaceae bacterium]